MSVIGLLIFPVGFLFILQFGLNLSATQTVLVLCGYGSVVSLLDLFTLLDVESVKSSRSFLQTQNQDL